mmetsp:Transcript_19566/g.19902  ORF Transcript_19566/g.19902 Transcript_19566/m.19902 type:complete len:152 (+) Transcript_19566:258-713(+)
MTTTTTNNDDLEKNSSTIDEGMNDVQAATTAATADVVGVADDANVNVNVDKCTTDIFSTNGWHCMNASSESKWWECGFYNYKSYQCINGFFSLYSINGLFCVLAVNGLYSMLSCNSFMSLLSFNSAFSIFSMNSFMSIGCMNGFMEICWGK